MCRFLVSKNLRVFWLTFSVASPVSVCSLVPVGVAEPGVASIKLSGFPEPCTSSSTVLLSAATAVLITVAVRVSGSPKSSMDVPVDTDFSVSAIGANAIISTLVPIEVSASSGEDTAAFRILRNAAYFHFRIPAFNC